MEKKQNRKIGFYIDTNAFVSYAKQKEPNHRLSKKFIDYIKKNMKNKKFNEHFNFLTSKFTEAEIASALKRQRYSHDKIRGFLHKISSPDWANAITPLPDPNLKIREFVPIVVEASIKYGATFADTVQACCIDLHRDNIDYVVTDDVGLTKVLKKKLKRIKIIGVSKALPQLQVLRSKKII